MPVPPPDKRFRRSHVRPTRRASWRARSLRALAAAALVVLGLFGVAGAVDYALSSPSLAIRRITVSGNQRLASGEVHALLKELIGTNMLTADIEASRRTLRTSPWVADVEIRRVFPAAVSVALVERRAVALGRIGGELYLVDQTGTIIDEFGPSYAEFDLPIVDGLVTGQGGGLLVDERRAVLAGRLLAALQARPELAARISQIDVTDVRDVVLVLKGDTVMVRVGSDRFIERLQTYVELAPTLHDRVPYIDYVDLRYDERVVVGPSRLASVGTRGVNE